ncbi:MAG: glycerate kinase type-2 family protein [Opitutales bacterium]
MSQETAYRKLAHEMIMAGVNVADPRQSIQDNVILEGDALTVRGDVFSLKDYDSVLLFGVGKAATPMCQAFEKILKPDDGLVITKIGEEICIADVETVPVKRAYHPEPRAENAEYSREILGRIDSIGEDEKVLVFLMVSGGGSALFSCAPEGVSIEDKFRLNQLLMKCGANIHDINTIRKHCSDIKGGKFGQRVSRKGGTLVSLILSDVVGDDLSAIASGPSYKDDSTFEDAVQLMKQYKIWEEAPQSIRDHMERGLQDSSMEPPREVPEGVYNYLIGNNLGALEAAKAIAEREGFNTTILTSQNTGEAKIVAKAYTGIAKEIQDSQNPCKAPACLIIGGEMIVTFNWEDRNGFGPCREFVLSAALEIQGRRNIVVAGCDTDGVDGDGKSGAIADGQTVSRATLDPQHYLDKHDAEIFFDSLDDSIQFVSMTNVNDIIVILVGEK